MEVNTNNIFKSLINDLLMITDDLPKEYNELLNDDEILNNDLFIFFFDNISKNLKKIKNKDISLFENEILKNINIKVIWNNEKTTDICKLNIWKYLQTFGIIYINQNCSNELKEVLNGNSKDINKENKKDVKDLKYIKEFKKSIEEINNKTIFDENVIKETDLLKDNILNSDIGKLAQDIAKDLDIENILKDVENIETNNPMDLMNKLLNNGGIQNLFNQVNLKVQDKISSGDINENMLNEQANNIYSNFQDNPILNTFMDVSKNMEEHIPKNKTQARLQKKINNKKVNK